MYKYNFEQFYIKVFTNMIVFGFENENHAKSLFTKPQRTK